MNAVSDSPGRQRFELEADGTLAAFTRYDVAADTIEFHHTETLPGFEGRGLASTLVRNALDDVRARGLLVRPYCQYVRGFIRRHPEYRDLVPPAELADFGLEDAR